MDIVYCIDHKIILMEEQLKNDHLKEASRTEQKGYILVPNVVTFETLCNHHNI